jgi:hypothetical protein
MTNISDGGALIVDGPSLSVGVSGSVKVDGLSAALPFVVRYVAMNELRVAFRADEATQAQLLPFLERMVPRKAA